MAHALVPVISIQLAVISHLAAITAYRPLHTDDCTKRASAKRYETGKASLCGTKLARISSMPESGSHHRQLYIGTVSRSSPGYQSTAKTSHRTERGVLARFWHTDWCTAHVWALFWAAGPTHVMSSLWLPWILKP